MAQDPNTQPDDDQTDQSMQGQDDQGDGGFTICIKVDAQGKISVGVTPVSDEDGDADDDDSDYQPVSSFNAAIRIARELYMHAGNQTDMQQAQSDMAAGYAGQ